MKNILLFILILISGISFSQTLPNDTIKTKVGDSLVNTVIFKTRAQRTFNYFDTIRNYKTYKIPITSAPANQLPICNAGNNQTIMLPLNGVTLTGSAIDNDGTITSVLWSRVSGPSTFTLGSPNNLTTLASGLIQGTYTFRLTATDNDAGTCSSNVTVTVSPQVDTTSTYPGYSKIFSDYFNKDSDLDPQNHSQAGNGFIDYSLKFEGAGSFASRTANVSAGTRSEVQLDQSSSPKEGIADYWIYYQSFQSDNGHDVQLHPDNNGSGTGFYHKSGKIVFVSVLSGTSNYVNYPTNYTPPMNKWIHVQWYFKWATSGGYCKIVYDGVTVLDVTNVQIGDGSNYFFKLGQNVWSGSGSIINYDKFDLWRKN